MYKRLASWWMTIGGVTYVASHLPEFSLIGENLISPFQLYQLASVALLAVALLHQDTRRVAILYIKRHSRLVTLLAVILVYCGVSVLLSDSDSIYSVALLAAGMAFAAALVVFGTISKSTDRLASVVIWSGLVLGAFSIFQVVGDNLDWPVPLTQILGTTTWTQIDFSRANGLSAEPQFLTTVLLLPMALVSLRLLDPSNRNWKNYFWAMALLHAAVFLSLSRGGFLAHSALGLVMITYGLRHQMYRRLAYGFASAVLALALTLSLLGWSGSLPGHQGARWVIYRYIEQASGGVLPLHTDYVEQNKATLAEEKPDKNLEVVAPEFGKRDDVGLIDESTTGRLDTYKVALRLWMSSLKNLVFGVGWGNFGAEAVTIDHRFGPKAITNNQPLQVVVELGLIGIGLFVWLAIELWRLCQRVRPEIKRFASIGLLAGLAVQLQFYSALHLVQLWFSLTFVLLWATETRKKT